MRRNGFTLAELLIALAILGVIATFAIPKILQSSQDSKYRSIAKEVAGTVSAAYQAYQAKNDTTYMRTYDLRPYTNYVSIKTSGLVDYVPTQGTRDCATMDCYVLHNGAILYDWGDSFCDSAPNPTALAFGVDPDGVPDGKSLGVVLYLYNNGKIRTFKTVEPNTKWGNGGAPSCTNTVNPVAGFDPSWFDWN